MKVQSRSGNWDWMVWEMKHDLYVEDRPVVAKWPRRLLAFAMIVVLSISVAYALYTKSSRDVIADTWLQFEVAMNEGQYTQALVILRDVQARVAGWDTEDGSTDALLYRDSLARMETAITGRTQAILALATRVNPPPLASDDKAFLTDLGEQTGMLVSAHLRSLCADLLNGVGTRAQVEMAFQTLAFLPNLSAPTRALRGELDTIESYAAVVQAAESERTAAAVDANQYFAALDQFNEIAMTSDGFVQTYALARVQDCKDAMLQPLSEVAQALLAASRYYSARDLLERMQAVFPESQPISTLYQQTIRHADAALEYHTDPIEHISVRPLIVTPARAFDGDENADAIAQNMLTVHEFRALLKGLYERGYILVDMHSMLDEEGMPVDLRVPRGKKPLLLTVETLNYYAHRAANGLCSDLVLDRQGNVCGQYLDTEGVMRIDREAEAIGILECFIEEYPDFSFDGAKGILSLTGYEGVFGAICNKEQLQQHNANLAELGLATQRLDESHFEANQLSVRAIATRLKNNGWRFASSTYDYFPTGAPETTQETVIADLKQWQEQVESWIGAVDILHYPNGSLLNGDDPRCMVYREQGYRFFTGLGPQAYVFYRDNYVYMDKTAIHGYALDHADLNRFFDAAVARDPSRP